jgi:hypothetical protein
MTMMLGRRGGAEEEQPAGEQASLITLALLLTDGWTRWRRGLELEKSRGADD